MLKPPPTQDVFNLVIATLIICILPYNIQDHRQLNKYTDYTIAPASTTPTATTTSTEAPATPSCTPLFSGVALGVAGIATIPDAAWMKGTTVKIVALCFNSAMVQTGVRRLLLTLIGQSSRNVTVSLPIVMASMICICVEPRTTVSVTVEPWLAYMSTRFVG